MPEDNSYDVGSAYYCMGTLLGSRRVSKGDSTKHQAGWEGWFFVLVMTMKIPWSTNLASHGLNGNDRSPKQTSSYFGPSLTPVRRYSSSPLSAAYQTGRLTS